MNVLLTPILLWSEIYSFKLHSGSPFSYSSPSNPQTHTISCSQLPLQLLPHVRGSLTSLLWQFTSPLRQASMGTQGPRSQTLRRLCHGRGWQLSENILSSHIIIQGSKRDGIGFVLWRQGIQMIEGLASILSELAKSFTADTVSIVNVSFPHPLSIHPCGHR